jgi:hypothetical protein
LEARAARVHPLRLEPHALSEVMTSTMFEFFLCTHGAGIKVADREMAAAYGRKCVARGANSFVADLTYGPAVRGGMDRFVAVAPRK